MDKPIFEGVITSEYIDAVFEYVYAAEFPDRHGENTGKRQVFQKVREVFRGRENESLNSKVFEPSFNYRIHPPQGVYEAMEAINQAFRKHCIPLEIEGVTRTGHLPKYTIYRIHVYSY